MKKLLTLLTLAAFAALQSQAAPAFFSNETAFLTALTGRPSFNETFASIAGGGTRLDTNNLVFSNANFSFTANIPGDPALKSFWGDTFGATRALSVGDPADVFVFTSISPNTAAFGGYFFPTYYDFDTDSVLIDPDGAMTINLLFADSSTDGVTDAKRNSVDINDWFFGWIAEEPGTAIQSVTMTAGINNSSAADVTLAVPEPSTYALLALAAAGMAGYVIRRRRKS